MSELLDKVRNEFQDDEYRHAYVEECLNSMIAAQIKVLREQRGMTQKQLAHASGMAQPRIPLLEDASYANWTINTLRRFARAFDVALTVKFESFSRFLDEFEHLGRATLQRPKFSDDAEFHSSRTRGCHRSRRFRGRRGARWSDQPVGHQPQVLNMGLGRKPTRSVGADTPSWQDASELGMQIAAAGGR